MLFRSDFDSSFGAFTARAVGPALDAAASGAPVGARSARESALRALRSSAALGALGRSSGFACGSSRSVGVCVGVDAAGGGSVWGTSPFGRDAAAPALGFGEGPAAEGFAADGSRLGFPAASTGFGASAWGFGASSVRARAASARVGPLFSADVGFAWFVSGAGLDFASGALGARAASNAGALDDARASETLAEGRTFASGAPAVAGGFAEIGRAHV